MKKTQIATLRETAASRNLEKAHEKQLKQFRAFNAALSALVQEEKKQGAARKG